MTKAAYAVLLTFVVGLIDSPFPFLPRQLTLIGTFSIGIPGFFLALAPEVDLIRPGFLRRVLWFSVPAGIAELSTPRPLPTRAGRAASCCRRAPA